MTVQYRNGGHWPLTAYPERWRANTKPEPMFPVILDCGDRLSFPAPAPRPGSALWCRDHGQVRVVAPE